MKLYSLLLLWPFLLLSPSSARANCYSGDGASGLPWDTVNVKLYVHFDPAVSSGPGMGLRYALNMSETDVEHVVIRTANILNEEGGGKIKLQYAGTTTSTTNILNAIVLRSANPDCSNAASGLQNAIAAASAVGVLGFRARAQIAFFRKHGEPCNPIAYTLQESGDDVVAVLIHELGHAFYDVGHSDTATLSCLVPDEYLSIMRAQGAHASGPWGATLPRWRVLKDIDRERFQQNHGVRGPYAGLFRSYRNPTGWAALQQVPNSVGWKFHYRPGSVTGNVTVRNVGSLINVSSSPQPGGGGIAHMGQYANGNFLNQSMNSESTMMRPVAVAAKPGTQEVLAVYAKRAFGTYGVDSDVGKICYRRSLNEGVTYASEVCETSVLWQIGRSGLTAAYSARGDVFVVGYVTPGEDMRVGMIPANGSTFPAHATTSIGFDKSWHAPAIACRDQGVAQQFNCLLVWEDKTNVGCRTTAISGVDISSASFVFQTPSNSPCFPFYDTPGLTHNNGTDKYELLYTSKNDAVYSYINTPGALNWTGDGDVWNSTNSFVLSGVVGYRASGIANKLQAYIVKYH
jgi:hypothetical protein